MIAALSLGMKLFFIMLTATGHATDVGCYQPPETTPNTCYVVTAYRHNGTWQSMTYYRITDTDYHPLWTISRQETTP